MRSATGSEATPSCRRGPALSIGGVKCFRRRRLDGGGAHSYHLRWAAASPTSCREKRDAPRVPQRRGRPPPVRRQCAASHRRPATKPGGGRRFIPPADRPSVARAPSTGAHGRRGSTGTALRKVSSPMGRVAVCGRSTHKAGSRHCDGTGRAILLRAPYGRSSSACSAIRTRVSGPHHLLEELAQRDRRWQRRLRDVQPNGSRTRRSSLNLLARRGGRGGSSFRAAAGAARPAARSAAASNSAT